LPSRGRVPASCAVDVEAFNQFFANKVADVRQNTSYSMRHRRRLTAFGMTYRLLRSRLTTDDLINAVRRLPNKSSAADPLSDNRSETGHRPVLILLDLTAAFDTVNHDIVLQRLHMSFGINDVALQWFHDSCLFILNLSYWIFISFV